MSRRADPPGRAALVEQKEALLAEMGALRRQLAAAEAAGDARRAGELSARLQALMSEERRLRLLIDRSPH